MIKVLVISLVLCVHLLDNFLYIGGKDTGVPVQVGVLRPGGVAAKYEY